MPNKFYTFTYTVQIHAKSERQALELMQEALDECSTDDILDARRWDVDDDDDYDWESEDDNEN